MIRPLPPGWTRPVEKAEGTDELREALAKALPESRPWNESWDSLATVPGDRLRNEFRKTADALLAGPLAPMLRDAAAWRATCAVIDDGQRVIVEGNDRALDGDRG